MNDFDHNHPAPDLSGTGADSPAFPLRYIPLIGFIGLAQILVVTAIFAGVFAPYAGTEQEVPHVKAALSSPLGVPLPGTP